MNKTENEKQTFSEIKIKKYFSKKEKDLKSLKKLISKSLYYLPKLDNENCDYFLKNNTYALISLIHDTEFFNQVQAEVIYSGDKIMKLFSEIDELEKVNKLKDLEDFKDLI